MKEEGGHSLIMEEVFMMNLNLGFLNIVVKSYVDEKFA
jgi:hypothetical protein